MKIIVCKGQIEVIEMDNKESVELLTDKDVMLHGVSMDVLKVNGGPFDEMVAYANTDELLDEYYKKHNSKRIKGE
jgi:hypothetical protein